MRKAFFVCIILSILFSACTPSVTLPDSDIPESKATINIELDDTASVVTETVSVPTNTQVPTVTPEPTPTETPEPTPTVKAESNIPSNIPTEKNENFDFEATDLLHWNEYQLVEVETLEESETVETAYEGENHLYLMPEGLYYNERAARSANYLSLNSITKLTLPAGYSFNIKEKRVVKNEKGEMLTLGIVENSFGFSNPKFVLLLNATDTNSESQGFVNEKERNANSITFINTYERIQPERVQGELLTLQRLSEYQQDIGGFKAGAEISLFDILQPTDDFTIAIDEGRKKPYLLGTEHLASGLNLLNVREDSSIEVVAKPKGQVLLQTVGPFAVTMETGDWGIAISPNETEDLIIKISPKGEEVSEDPDARYFFKVEPIFSNIDMNKLTDLGQRTATEEHARIIYGATVTLVREEPEGQVEMLNTLSQNFQRYITSKGTIPMVIPQGITSEKYFLGEGNVVELLGTGKPFPYYPKNEYQKFLQSWRD